MRLKKLEVFGFKSFFDKTVVTFQSGITAVVGPNGCGKSNLADAILWVMGEQSPKTLRGERMEDVIFNGTEQRKALGVAEVSLTFGDISGELSPPYSPYSEITVSRRLFRSGESEYLINKTPCRLKDVRDLLIDTGAGYRAHTVIEQGKVDDLISASPIQRREIVEEAAGIAKYRIRKAEALRKLEATEQNLVRVRDIISEVKRQINSLDRQARKAEKYQKLREELKSLDLRVAGWEWNQWKETREGLEREASVLEESAALQESRIASLDLQQAETRLLLTQKEQELGRIKNQVFEIEGKIQRLEGKIETLHAQRREWEEARSRTDQEISEIGQAEASLQRESESFEVEGGELDARLPEQERLLAGEQEKSDRLEQALSLERENLEEEKRSLFEVAARLTRSQNNLVHIEARKEELQRRKGRGALEREEVQRKKEGSEEAVRRLQRELEETGRRLEERSEASASAARLLKETEAFLKMKSAQLAQIKEEWAAKSARAASREGFYRGLLGRQEGSENLLFHLEGLQGMVADLIEVPTLYEKAIEAVLENRLRGIVVEGHAEIKKGIERLRSSQEGRGMFFPRTPRVLKSAGAPLERIEGEGVIGRARDHISCRPGYEAIADLLLGEVILVQDLDSAFRLWDASPNAGVLATLEGEVIDPSGVVSGGGRGEAGLLEQKREIKLLSDQMARLHADLKSLEAGIEQDQVTLQETRLRLESLSSEIRSIELERLDKEKDHAALLAEIDRFQNALQTVLFEQEEGDKEESEILAKEESERNLITENQRSKEEKEGSLNLRQAKLDELHLALGALKEEVVRLKMETASLKEKRLRVSENLSRIGRAKEDLSQRLLEKERLLGALREKSTTGEAEEREAVAGIEQLAAERERFTLEIRAKTEVLGAVMAGLQKVEEEMAQLRSALDQTQKGLQEKALRKIEAQMTQEKIRETILMSYQIEICDYPFTGLEGSPEESREKAGALRRSLEEMGPVNLGAIEEYRELEARYQFLTTQESDLTTSMESLRQAIAKINKTTQTLFVDTFHTLNQKFGEVFTSFFGGGKAELLLVDEAHPLDSGIEMIAQPPGKKPRSITLLSGGEKALTAISLLFATFLIHPSPFCLLDEIDAPLDEENTRRFTQAVSDMARRTQFIIVTHNKRTMEIADVLYGVTMEETGVSKLVSVDLNDKARRSNGSNGHPVPEPVASDAI